MLRFNKCPSYSITSQDPSFIPFPGQAMDLELRKELTSMNWDDSISLRLRKEQSPLENVKTGRYPRDCIIQWFYFPAQDPETQKAEGICLSL